MKHSPLPWKISEEPTDSTDFAIVDKDNKWVWFDRPNAEFIIRACNMHYELMEALEKAKEYIEKDIKPFDQTEAEDLCIDISEVLGKAK